MAIVTLSSSATYAAGQTAVGTIVRGDLNTIANDYNGNIDASNINTLVAMPSSKLPTITTGGKVSGAALTLLGSIPTSAGSVPGVNLIGTITGLTDIATIVVDASLGTIYTVTIAGNRTLQNPSNSTAWQKMIVVFTQDATGGRTITLDTNYYLDPAFGTGTNLPIALSPSKSTYVGMVYNGTSSQWHILSISGAF